MQEQPNKGLESEAAIVAAPHSPRAVELNRFAEKKIMRNLVAIIVGVISSFLFLTATVYIFAYLNIGQFRQVIKVDFTYDSLRIIIKYSVFGVLPISSASSGFVQTMIARDKFLICGLISIVPILSICLNMPMQYSIMAIPIVLLSMTFGVIAGKRLKRLPIFLSLKKHRISSAQTMNGR
jgi:hypothetical protein